MNYDINDIDPDTNLHLFDIFTDIEDRFKHLILKINDYHELVDLISKTKTVSFHRTPTNVRYDKLFFDKRSLDFMNGYIRRIKNTMTLADMPHWLNPDLQPFDGDAQITDREFDNYDRYKKGHPERLRTMQPSDALKEWHDMAHKKFERDAEKKKKDAAKRLKKWSNKSIGTMTDERREYIKEKAQHHALALQESTVDRENKKRLEIEQKELERENKKRQELEQKRAERKKYLSELSARMKREYKEHQNKKGHLN